MIKISSLKEGNKILLETKESIFEIEVLTPSTGRISISGGKRFPARTKAKIIGSYAEDGTSHKLELHKDAGIELEYKDDGETHLFVTSPVLSAKVEGVGANGPWTYEVWEKPDIQGAVVEARKRI